MITMEWNRINTAILLTAMLMAGVAYGQPGQAPNVRVDAAAMRTLSSTTLVPGTVVSRNDANLAAEVEGRLVSVLDVGSRVSGGDPVARIEDTVLKLLQAELDAQVSRAEARLRFLEGEERRFAKLAEENLAAAAQLDQTRSDRDVANGDLRVARARLAQNQDQLARTVIRAPFDGVIVERRLMPGEWVTEGSDVVRLVDQEDLEVIARAPLEFYRFVQPGHALDVRAGSLTEPAIVRTVVAVGDENTHQFEFRLDLERGLFPVGQTLRVSVPTSGLQEVLVVHRDALVLRPEGISLFVVDAENQVRQVSVTTGISSGDHIEVRGAIAAGDRVVVRGNERLQPGQTVNVAGS
jgi:RND family efflux transporter MFP subunit